MTPANHVDPIRSSPFTPDSTRFAPQLRGIAILGFAAALWTAFVLATSGVQPLGPPPAGDGTALLCAGGSPDGR